MIRIVLTILVVGFISSSQQPLLMAFSSLVLFINYKLFWIEKQPKSIFFGLLLFWFSVIVLVIYADITNIVFEDLSISPNIVKSAYYAMEALLILSLSIYAVIRRIPVADIDDLAWQYDSRKVAIAYLTSIFFTVSIQLVGRSLGLGELIKALVLLRGGIIFVLIFVFYKKNNSIVFPVLLIAIEIVLSLFSYFSSFKDLLILFAVSFTFFKVQLNVKQVTTTVIGLAVALYMILIWQSIKSDYREFLSGGERSQQIVVDRGAAIGKFFELASSAKILDPDIWFATLERISYIEFFSESTDNVPDKIPHTNGKLWIDNISHVLVPRLLNKDKKAIYDSEMVNTYATRQVAGADVGTSWSLGWLAESYIDFGYTYMFIPVLLIGLMIGSIYRFIMSKSYSRMWACAFVAPLWVYINNNGTAGAKVLGWWIVYVVVFFLINKFLIPKLDRLLRTSDINESSLKYAQQLV